MRNKLGWVIRGDCNIPSPDGQVVHITSMSIDEDNLVVNCKYDIRPPSEGTDISEVPEGDDDYYSDDGSGSDE